MRVNFTLMPLKGRPCFILTDTQASHTHLKRRYSIPTSEQVIHNGFQRRDMGPRKRQMEAVAAGRSNPQQNIV